MRIKKRRKKLRIPERISPPATTPIGLILSLGCPTSKKAPIGFRKEGFYYIPRLFVFHICSHSF
jgi:hypothetical protein